MTSGNFTTLSLAQITVDRAVRQRKELPRIEELAESIAAVGLINPIVVDANYNLIAGERRFEAMKLLGWLEAPVQWAEDLDPLVLHMIELEENVKRVDLSWQDHNDAIAHYHELKSAMEPEWSQEQTAAALGMAHPTVSQHLTVAQARKTTPALEIDKAEKFSTAYGLAQRSKERAGNVALRAALGAPAPLEDEDEDEGIDAPLDVTKELDRYASIQTADFNEWANKVHKPFNLIHCDFPYGVSTGDKKGQSAAKRLGSYADGEEVYFTLLQTLVEKQDNFIAPQAHLLFWFSMKFYQPTVELLEGAGWRVDPFPFIWHKADGAGIIPDPNRGPRRTYETALFASRGDRKIVRPVANSFSCPTTKQFHTSEKAHEMLSHFFRMLLDSSTRLLDPTCGSGMAVRVAEEMGASYALGLERDPEFAATARKNCKL